MKADGRTGWYLRVIEPGTVPVAGPILVAARHPAGVTVLDAHRARSTVIGTTRSGTTACCRFRPWRTSGASPWGIVPPTPSQAWGRLRG